jgi:5-methylcytosine-specific restriction endonuclease McrA
MPYKDLERRRQYNNQWQKQDRKKHPEKYRAIEGKFRATAKRRMWEVKYQQSAEYKKQQRKRSKLPKWKATQAASAAKRKGKLFGASGSWTGKQFLALCKKYGNVCLCCHKQRKLTPDHVIPLCRGGSNTLSNIQPLCLPCNVKKHNKATDYRKTPKSYIAA